ncbi:MAG: FAD-dependent oxidoreductase [Pirellulaceae bacterium]|nr:FAD-dependent oxidoreductase [Pirellulaceae bacterium]
MPHFSAAIVAFRIVAFRSAIVAFRSAKVASSPASQSSAPTNFPHRLQTLGTQPSPGGGPSLRHLAAIVCCLLTAASVLADESPRDVVIYGGTSAGVAAAVQVVRQGKTCLVIEPGRHLGGLTSGGLGWTDSGSKAAIGGIAREFYQRVRRHYDRPEAWVHEKASDYDRYRPDEDAMWTFEPHVAEAIYEQLVREHGIAVIRGERLDRQRGVARDGLRITSIGMESGRRFPGRMFIDATYEGDLMAAAGVRYAVGRESNATYGETLNGVQKAQNVHNHRFIKPVDPYVTAGDPTSGLLPGVQAEPPGEDGQGDDRVQAYCFRMCMSNVPAGRVPFPKPEGYDELRYELLLRNFEAGDLRLPLKPDMMPNGKTDTNNNCAFSTDNIGLNYAYPEADYAERERIIAEHTTYQQGLMWTLANHPRVPDRIRAEMSQWGLAADEFRDNGHWPHQLYVREARRMVGDYVMTEQDCRRLRVADDSVGLGSYNMDSHNVQRYVTPEGHVQNEGDVQVSPGGPYVIGYRCLVPRRGEAENLLVPVCLSSSHIAYGSIRMEPVFMILGQSAATAAVQALDDGTSVQDVDYARLRRRLLEDKQVLDLPPGAGPKRTIAAGQLPGVAIDDNQARLTGAWLSSSSVSPFVETGYRHDNDEGKGEKSARFETPLEPGEYEVRLSYSPNPNRSGSVPVAIHHAGGVERVTVDQRRPPDDPHGFVSLGRFRFDRQAAVVVSNEGTRGHVIIDCVQFLPRK